MTGESIPADLSGQAAPDIAADPGIVADAPLDTAPEAPALLDELRGATRNTDHATKIAAGIADGLAAEDAEDGLMTRLDALVGTAGLLARLLGESVERHMEPALNGNRLALEALGQLSTADGRLVAMPETDRAQLEDPEGDGLSDAIASALLAQQEGSTGYATDLHGLLVEVQRVKDRLEMAQVAVSGLRNRLREVTSTTHDVADLLGDATNDARAALNEFSGTPGDAETESAITPDEAAPVQPGGTRYDR